MWTVTKYGAEKVNCVLWVLVGESGSMTELCDSGFTEGYGIHRRGTSAGPEAKAANNVPRAWRARPACGTAHIQREGQEFGSTDIQDVQQGCCRCAQ